MEKLTKNFPVFDCDAHVNDPEEICQKYVPESEKDLVRATYWTENGITYADGQPTMGGSGAAFAPYYNPICIAGPQMTKQIQHRLNAMAPLDEEQREYLEHKGAYNAAARLTEMDLMGIDQVLVIPTLSISGLPPSRNAPGVVAYCRAYNNWVNDWCSESPERLYPSALLPLQDPIAAATEVHRVAELGFHVGLVRPIDANGNYPNNIGSAALADMARSGDMMASTMMSQTFDPLFRALEETGMCLGMHTFPGGMPDSPGGYVPPGVSGVGGQAYSFIYEAQAWLGQVLMAGFLDRYPDLTMLVFESNSGWLPSMLDNLDRLFKLYSNERSVPSKRLPSEAFYEQCGISFESDETTSFRQWKQFEDIGLWASDCYHFDGADVWSGIRYMNQCGVPEAVQAKLLGGNATRFYGIEPKMFITEEADPIDRPDWFPQGPELEEWTRLMADPRTHADEIAAKGWNASSGTKSYFIAMMEAAGVL
jgi:uncharacterized protein